MPPDQPIAPFATSENERSVRRAEVTLSWAPLPGRGPTAVVAGDLSVETVGVICSIGVAIRQLATDDAPCRLVVDLAQVMRIDREAVQLFADGCEELEAAGIEIRVVNSCRSIRDALAVLSHVRYN